ncbi:MAG: hypothetical protein CL498_03690 [Actinobacteria bacterium]|nr:hypothetical protein [Actinomycetota bacterium]
MKDIYEAKDVGDMYGESDSEFYGDGENLEPSNEDLTGTVSSAIDDAVDYIDNTISPLRATAIEYYQGLPFGNEEDGRSQVVSRDVHDTIADIMPSLMRIFFSTENVVDFVPFGKEDVKTAEQATDFINKIVLNQDNDGFTTFYNAFKDALLCKNGIVKYYWDDNYNAEYFEYEGLDDDSLAVLESDTEVEIIKIKSYPNPAFPTPEATIQVNPEDMAGMEQQPMEDTIVDETVVKDMLEEEKTPEQMIEDMLPPEAQEVIPELMQQSMMIPQLHDVKLRRKKEGGCIRVESLPPEEFLIDRNATSMDDAYLVGHRRYLTVSELVEMGYDYDDVMQYATPYDMEMDDNAEYRARHPLGVDTTDSEQDDSNLKVQYIEAYMKVDMTGDGLAELRRICCLGDSYEIRKNLPCSHIPFVSFCPDPEPHTFFGTSIADITQDIQKVKSMILRSMLDSLALSVHPRVAVVEGQANIEDVMNTEVGGIIRTRNAGAVQPFSVPFVGQQAFPMLQYMDEIKENRTGMSKASMGLDADALQSTTAAAVNATVKGGQQHIELIARIFAEKGMKPLFKGILELLSTHQSKERMVRLRNEWTPIDPRAWDAGMDVVVNVGLGNGSSQERMQYLSLISGKQEQILQTLGADNPLVEMTQYRNTMAKMVELAGFKDAGMFFKEVQPLSPQQKAMMQQQKKPDAAEQLIQVQIEEIKADMAKSAARLELDKEKMKRSDDLDRDKLDSEILLKAAEIEAKYGSKVETEVIRALVERDREQMKMQQNLISTMNRGIPQ